jgi:hypothetical protein
MSRFAAAGTSSDTSGLVAMQLGPVLLNSRSG